MSEKEIKAENKNPYLDTYTISKIHSWGLRRNHPYSVILHPLKEIWTIWRRGRTGLVSLQPYHIDQITGNIWTVQVTWRGWMGLWYNEGMILNLTNHNLGAMKWWGILCCGYKENWEDCWSLQGHDTCWLNWGFG